MRKQTLLGLLVAIYWVGQPVLSAQHRTTFMQDPASTYLAIEAEDFSTYFDHNPSNTDLPSWSTINDALASNGKALKVVGGAPGSNGTGVDALQDAKANYYLQFTRAGDYHLYVRYKHVASGSSFYLADGFGRAVRLVSPKLPNSTPDGQFQWQKVELQARGDFAGQYEVQDKDLGKVLTFNLWPREQDFEIDRFVLSQEDDLTSAELTALANTPNQVPPYRRNLLQYTSFEGLNQELGILSSTSSSFINFPGNTNGEFFPYLGQQALYLDQQFGGLAPQVTLRPVKLDCYTQSQVCFRWFSPAALTDEFEASDRFRVNLIFLDDGNNEITTYPILDVPGAGIQPINTLGDGYLEYCYTIHDDNASWPLPDNGASPAPVSASKVSIQFNLTASEDNEDIVIDEVYFTTTDPNPVDANIDHLSIQADNQSVQVDATGSVGAFLYLYAFSDGTIAPPLQDPSQLLTHTFASPGAFGVTLYALDACSNIRDVDFRTISSLLPVEWSYFYAKAEGDDVQLSWGTQTETNNYYFQVEWSRDGRQFFSIGTVEGTGNSQIKQDYSFRHPRPGSGLHYYRVKQVDYDGSFEYSVIRSVELLAATAIQFFPNPVGAALEIRKSWPGDFLLSIIDLQGRVILERWSRSAQDSWPLEGLAAGLYLVRYQDQSGVRRIWRMVKE